MRERLRHRADRLKALLGLLRERLQDYVFDRRWQLRSPPPRRHRLHFEMRAHHVEQRFARERLTPVTAS